MNGNAFKKEFDLKQKNSALNLILTVLSAFIAALLFRRSMGVIAMIPLSFGVCFAAAFINVKFYLKGAIFALTVFSLNSIEQGDISVPITFAALCLLTLALFQFSVDALKSNKTKGIIFSSASAVVCIVLSLIFIGNPISAIISNKNFDSHIKSAYPDKGNEVLGDFRFSNIYYDFSTKAYTIDASCTKFPTESGTLTTSDNIITDRFYSRMEKVLTEPYILEMTDILRTTFPLDSFSVSCDEILLLPNENLLEIGNGDLYENLVFEIFLGGVQNYDSMEKKVLEYMTAIKNSDMKFARIIFKSRIGEFYHRSVTIHSNFSLDNPVFETRLILKNSPDRFNRLLDARFNKEQYLDYVNLYLSDRRGICHKHKGVDCFCFN